MDTLQYPWPEPPQTGRTLEVAPGVMWMRMPMPSALNHINVWALRDLDPQGRPGWCVVDTGMFTPPTVAAWEQLLDPQGDLQGLPVVRVVVTHMHPDHVGMAGWLTRRFDVPLWMSRLEYLHCRVLVNDTGRPVPAEGRSFYQQAGWNSEHMAAYERRFGDFGRAIDRLPESFCRLHDAQVIQMAGSSYEVVIGRGHSPEHVCLYNRQDGVLISGDQVLPKISSNVSVYPTEPHADPLSDWLASIAHLRSHIAPDVLVLPAHNLPFRGLHQRLNALEAGTHKALGQLLGALDQPRRVIDVFGALFSRPITDAHLWSLATGESLAHLNHLLGQHQIHSWLDAQGVAWFCRHPTPTPPVPGGHAQHLA